MKPYISKNTQLRMNSKNSIEKIFFILLNNSIFGKTIGNIRKRQKIFLVKLQHLERFFGREELTF